MSNVINFPAAFRPVAVASASAVNAEIIPFPCLHGNDEAYRAYARSLKRALRELARAQAAGDYYQIGEWKDEIDVLRLHSEWYGYQDIVGRCQNALQAG